MADGSVKQGVPRQMAIQFAAQTLLGAAKTVLQTGKHPAVLRDEVLVKYFMGCEIASPFPCVCTVFKTMKSSLYKNNLYF